MDTEGNPAATAPVGPIVLVVDDNVDNQELLAYLLEWLGLRTDIVGNGVEAVAAFARTEYAAVFMDCEMPQMDGFQATAELRRLEPPGRRTPILAITAHPVQAVRERCVAAGMDDCLSKPVGVEDLRRALAAVPLRDQPRLVAPSRDFSELDLTALTKLADLIGVQALGALLETFWRETDGRLTRLRAAVAARDLPEVARVAHAIKGGASSLGAERVAKLSDELQHLADAGSLTEAAQSASALEEAFARARTAGAEMLDSTRQRVIGANPDVIGIAEIPQQTQTQRLGAETFAVSRRAR